MGRRLLIQAAGFLSRLRWHGVRAFLFLVLESSAQRSILRLFRRPAAFKGIAPRAMPFRAPETAEFCAERSLH